ncbi:MAG: hypothetical protein HY334_04275 [Armatimonadetes bacterium]|nr:hypothetical protein [Armatimonadota bacterium]
MAGRWASIGTSALALVLATGCLGSFAPPATRPGLGRERTVTILVEGTPGLAFTGSYGTPLSTVSTRGTVPARYTVKTAAAVAATFVKEQEEGELILRLLADGQEVMRRTTRAPFGTVVVAYQFVQ